MQVRSPWRQTWPHSPAEHNDEVHDVPAVPQVRAFMENKTERHQFNPRLEAEDPDEVRLGLLLRKQSARRKTVRLGSKNGSTCKVESFHSSHYHLGHNP